MVSKKTKKEVWLRDKERCVICKTKYILERTPHHVFQLSEYFKEDKNDAWNLCTICQNCHRVIHFASNDDEIKRGKEFAKRCKKIALARYKGKYRNKLIEIIKSRYGNKW